jgi:hypothetical protein
MGFVSEWNSNNRASQPAQHLLQLLLQTVDLDTLATLPDIGRLVDALIPYTRKWLLLCASFGLQRSADSNELLQSATINVRIGYCSKQA